MSEDVRTERRDKAARAERLGRTDENGLCERKGYKKNTTNSKGVTNYLHPRSVTQIHLSIHHDKEPWIPFNTGRRYII